MLRRRKYNVSTFRLLVEQGSTCIVNAASERDMAVFASGMIQANSSANLICHDKSNIIFLFMYCSKIRNNWQAELKGKRFLCRTAASFVSARIGIIPKAPVLPKDLQMEKEKNGGLIVVGSYVPKTTKQV